jgi:hypothetical protein
MTEIVGLGDSASVTVIRSTTLLQKLWPYAAFIVFIAFLVLFFLTRRTRVIKNKDEGLA